MPARNERRPVYLSETGSPVLQERPWDGYTGLLHFCLQQLIIVTEPAGHLFG